MSERQVDQETNISSKREQCHVDSRRRRLNSDLLLQERSSGVVIVESRLCFRVVHAETFRKYTFIAENPIAVVRAAVELFESECIYS